MADFNTDLDGNPPPLIAGAVEKVRVIDLGAIDGGHLDLSPAIRAAFHDAMTLRKILEAFGGDSGEGNRDSGLIVISIPG